MSRRNARGSRRTPGQRVGAAVVPMSFLSGFTTTDYASAAPGPTGVQWTANGFAAQVLRWPTLAVGAATRTSNSRRQGSAGYWMRSTGAINALDAQAFDGSGGAPATPAYTVLPGDAALVMMQVVTWDGATLRNWVKRLQVGAGTAMVGHTPGAAAPVGFGFRGDLALEPAVDTQLHGIAQGVGALSQAQVEAWFDAVKATGRLVACPGVATGLVRYVDNTGAIVGTGDALAITGSLTLTTVASPSWSW